MTTKYPDRRRSYTTRSSYYTQAKHINDVFLNLGFNYRGKLLKRGTSSELWVNPLQIQMFNTIESMLNFLIEHTKIIKKWFSIAHDKNTMNI